MIVFVRHGETPPNRDGLLLGRADPPLTDRGRAQAKDLGHLLAARSVARVLTSPLRRARDTASPIAAECGTSVDVDERLIEIDYGEWEGQPFGALDADVVGRWHRDPDLTPPGGESLTTVAERVSGFCDEWLRDENEGVIVAVSHGLTDQGGGYVDVRRLTGARLAHAPRRRVTDAHRPRPRTPQLQRDAVMSTSCALCAHEVRIYSTRTGIDGPRAGRAWAPAASTTKRPSPGPSAIGMPSVSRRARSASGCRPIVVR
jgi:broad specificity phosphatase PhoE